MATSAIPLVLTGLYNVGSALANVTATYGPGITGADGDQLWIGVDDPDSLDPKQAAAETQKWANTGAGRSRDAEGTVTCVVAAETGDGTSAGLLDTATRAFSILGAFETAIRADITLGGIATLLWAETEDIDLSWNQTDQGAYALITFTIHYLARI